MDRRRFLKYVGSALLLSGLSTLGYSYFIESGSYVITRIDIGLGIGRRLVHITDTHVDTSRFDYAKLPSIIEGLNPDIIIHTGDHLTYFRGYSLVRRLLEALASISEVYTVLGNHDVWSGLDRAKYINEINGIENVRLLVNEGIYIDGFWIIGVGDPYTGGDDLDRALGGIGDDSVRILIAHSPQIIDKAVGRVDLVLSGHTHGGQIVLPLLGPLWLPLPLKYWRYSYGLFELDGTTLFVSRGIGTTSIPLRFNCPPEIVYINL